MKIIAISYQPNCTNYIEALLSFFPKADKLFLKKERYQNNKNAILSMIKKKIQKSKYLLISGTSATDSFEKKVRRLFYKLKLPVFIVLDSTFNIKKRFINDDYLNPIIFVNDNYAKNQLIKNKFLYKKIFNFGNIYLESLLKKFNISTNIKSNRVLLISQPLTERKKKFNEVSCFKNLYNLCLKKNYFLDIKTHPRENSLKWEKFYKIYKFNIISNTFKKINLRKYKYIFGINTESFLECVVQNRNTYALNFTKIYNDNFCIRNKFVRLITNQKELNNLFFNNSISINTNIKSLNKKSFVGKNIIDKIKYESKNYF